MNDQINDVKKTHDERLDDIERKLNHIIEILGIKSLQNKTVISSREDIPPIPKVDSPRPAAVFNENLKKKSESSNLLPILGIICFFLAGIFIVKLAIDSGWMTAEKQWGLLSIFGVALASFSLFFDKLEKSYRSYAGAAGVVILYLAAYSSHLYFGLFNSITAMSFAALVSILCFYMFHYFKTELFLIICVIGTYISPVMLDKSADFIYLSSFFLIWAGLFSRLAIYFKSRTITLMASYLGLGIFTAMHLSVYDPDLLRDIILVQSLQFIIYAGGVYFYSVKNKDHLSQKEAIAYLPILLFFYGTIYYFLNKYNPLIAPWISLGFACFIYFLYWRASKKVDSLQSQTMVEGFFSVVLFHSGYWQLIPHDRAAWLLPLIILGMYISEQKENFKKLGPPIKIMFFAIAVIEFGTLCFTLLINPALDSVVPAAATIAIGTFYYLKGAKAVKNKEGLFLSLLHVVSILALYRIAYDYGTLAVTLSWGLYSIIILAFGYIKRNAIVAKSSLIVLMVTCFKALVFDASQTSSGNRIGSLILTGAVLYGAGYFFQKINKWNNE